MIGIYRVYNTISNKSYIGQSINIERRIKEHFIYYANEKSVLHQAIQKYGPNNFNWEVLEQCTVNELDEKERYWIKYYNSYESGYNITIGGQKGHCRTIDYEFIKSTYESTGSITETSRITNYNKRLIATILNDLGVDRVAIKESIKKSEIDKKKKLILQISPKDMSIIATFNSQKEAASIMKFSRQSLSRAIHNGSKLFGYFWAYANSEEEPTLVKHIMISRYDKNTGKLLSSYSTYSDALIDIKCADTIQNRVVLSKIKNGHRQDKEAFGYIWGV